MTVKLPPRFPFDAILSSGNDVPVLQSDVVDGVRWFRDVEYASLPGYRPLLLDVGVPVGVIAPELVVLIHGGAWQYGSHKIPPTDPSDLNALRTRLLAEGFAVASVQYRHSSEAIFPSQLHDVKAAIRWLRSASEGLGVNARRIGTVGESAGGHLALLLGTNVLDPEFEGRVGVTGPSSSVDAAVSWYGPTRLATMEAESLPGPMMRHSAGDSPESALIGGAISDHRDLADRASPITHVSADSAPTLLIHGKLDQLVPYQQSVAYADALHAAGVPSELILLDDGDHCFFGVDVAPVIGATVGFLQGRLRDV